MKLRFFAGLMGLGLAAWGQAQTERVTVGQLVLENVPEVPAALAERTAQYQNTRAAAVQDWLASGGGLLITTRFGNTSQVHEVREPLGMRRQLTFFDEPVQGVSVSPNARYDGFTFLRDVGGGEFYQLYWFDRATGSTSLLSDGKSRNSGALWSHGGDEFVYTSTRRNGRDNDIYRATMEAPAEAELLLETRGSWAPVAWSPDDRRLLLFNYISVTHSRIFILDVETRVLTEVNPRPEDGPTIAYRGVEWAHDSRGLWLVSDEDSEFARLRYFDLATGEQTVLTPDIDWDVAGIELSPDGGTLVFSVNAGGTTEVHLMTTRDRSVRRLEGLPMGQAGGFEFAPEGERLAFTVNSPQTPGDVYVLNLADGKLVRWTDSEIGGLDGTRFVTPEIIEFPTFDDAAPGQRRQIPALYYRPARVPAGQRLPVLVMIHGGPESQSTVSFSPLTQFLVNELGLAVIYPNVRGSTGYGKTYVTLDNGFKREDSVRDIGALLDWIETQPELDSDRVGVYGGSYGGYMVLASMTHYNDRLAAGIDVVGISNFITFLENTQDYRRDLRRVEYGDERDPAMRAHLEKISPLAHMGRVTKPMLIAQGYNDPRVPVGEAEQVLAALKENGAKPWYFLAMDEGHGFAKKNNRDHFQNVMVLFLERHLLTSPAR